jgi:hypothetical protein
MTDEFDRLLEGALAVRADDAPQCAGVTDVRRRVRRRRQRRSALTALPVLVGAGAAATWVRSSEQQSVASSGTDVVSTTTDGVFATSTSLAGAGSGFRCVAATMTAYDSGGWAYFEACEPWTLSDAAPPSTTPAVEPTTTLWAGPSTESVVFINASTVNGVAMQMMSQHFGAGQPVSALTTSATSFVMYDGPGSEPLAAAIATELQLPLRLGLDDRFVPTELLPAPTVAVVIGDDLATELASTVPDEPTTVPAATLPTTGVAMRCWEPSKVPGGDENYRYFQTCERKHTADITTTTTTTTTTTSTTTTTESTFPSGTTTTTLAGADCVSGQYTIVETDMSRQEVAGKFDLTVEELDAANSLNTDYPAFYPGLVIAIPCPSGA